MVNSAKCWCIHCKQELEPSHLGPCPKCGKTGKECRVTAEARVGIRGGFQARQKRKGFKKFILEIISRWRPSHHLPKGVLEKRVIDKEHDKYDQIVEDASTGQIIHEEHEPLSKHRTEPRGRA